jgi:hypothetical protein
MGNVTAHYMHALLEPQHVHTVPHSETHGFDNADKSRAAYAQCHELLAGCCNIITQNGGVARELTPTDWHLLSNIVVSHPFHARMLASRCG